MPSTSSPSGCTRPAGAAQIREAYNGQAMGGDDLRDMPLYLRKMNLQRLFARRPEGISVVASV
ncbi:hypothetical protein GGD65_007979 [Bradyrhizobium sp. CIR18]|uniref:hypothetical protein n=1 Tax=Bradyrhizobium sp. CIR18 TaxID=2663839 RepID=UPI0016063304|nr:hypothetical protein [Bradyrhizobium sp. CIR18]MBB4366905.1 hypothetical protein [Bradyrhizobium sp. CIR18]